MTASVLSQCFSLLGLTVHRHLGKEPDSFTSVGASCYGGAVSHWSLAGCMKSLDAPGYHRIFPLSAFLTR